MTDKEQIEELCEDGDHDPDPGICPHCGSDEGTEPQKEERGWVTVCVSCGCVVYNGRK